MEKKPIPGHVAGLLAVLVSVAGCGSAERSIEVSLPPSPQGRTRAMLARQVQVVMANGEGDSVEVSRREVSHLGTGLTLDAMLPEGISDGGQSVWTVTAYDERGSALLSGSGAPGEDDGVVRIQLKEE